MRPRVGRGIVIRPSWAFAAAFAAASTTGPIRRVTRVSSLIFAAAVVTPLMVVSAQGAGGTAADSIAPIAQHAMIASNSALASSAGIEIMKRGGNAVDAAVAVGFALAVALPSAGNLGGGGYMLIHLANGRNAALDYREEAPGSASRDMYLTDGKVTGESVAGYRASGVPGSVAGLCEASRRYGKLPLRVVMAPAIELAEKGFVVDSATFQVINRSRNLIARFAGADLFLPNGSPPPVGTVFRQPALARTLRAIAHGGAAAFYRGAPAQQIAAEMRAHGGTISATDLARYHAVWRTPLTGVYRGYTLLTMPPSSSGGITMLEAMNLLATYPAAAPFGSTAHVHTLASAFQRAFVDRNARLGDPAFVRMPVAALVSGEYARRVRATISDFHTPTGDLTGPMSLALHEHTETTHYSVMDRAGNAVSTTTTLNDLFGSGVYVSAAGFFMNDVMDDFTTHPGTPNMFGLIMGEANSIAPGKRMLSSMSPTIVLDSTGKTWLAIGARGGPRITTATAQVTLNLIDHHMSLVDAMRAPRIHHQALPDTLMYERNAISSAVADSLRAIGWTLAQVSSVATVDAVLRLPDGLQGMDDPRHGARAIGY